MKFLPRSETIVQLVSIILFSFAVLFFRLETIPCWCGLAGQDGGKLTSSLLRRKLKNTENVTKYTFLFHLIIIS